MPVTFDKYALILGSYVFDRNPHGCSKLELLKLEKTLNTILPEDYELFLRTCGHHLDDFMRGSDFCYSILFELDQWARELIEESNAKTLPEGSIVFLMHQGYQFFFLNETGVYYYFEGWPTFEKKYDSFADYFCAVYKYE